MRTNTVLIRLVFIGILIGAGYLLDPIGHAMPGRPALFGIPVHCVSAILALIIAAVIIVFEMRIQQASLKTLIGAGIGSMMGIVGGVLIGFLISYQEANAVHPSTKVFLTLALAFIMAYIGLMVGAAKGDYLDLSALGGIFSDKATRRDVKILDTSVIIDGRIADVAETGFLSGTIVIPQFILRELQQVADSPDGNKRQRGRRGLDMLNRLQSNPSLDIQVVDTDFPAVKEVDLKLLELSKSLDGVVVTNDFNLNKVAQVHGLQVLNINELANSLKPVVLPGEAMRVFILKEGKEYNQGVAYLDDGTMVVVDNARRMIGKNADIAVTSVLQTTAGKMIFGRLWEDSENGSGGQGNGPAREREREREPSRRPYQREPRSSHAPAHAPVRGPEPEQS
ncbi:MAG TPA: TRAM domain-containing protein [Pyrinomonadaceae bacterium]|nr:TRAM domain-containing protein [Pyrinomonadaceae bacterium]